MKKELTFDDVARFEKAIAKKYGEEAIQNPRKHWNDEKEEKHQEQLRMLAEIIKTETTAALKESELRGRLEKDKIGTIKASFESRLDDTNRIEDREERWLSGWRPKK